MIDLGLGESVTYLKRLYTSFVINSHFLGDCITGILICSKLKQRLVLRGLEAYVPHLPKKSYRNALGCQFLLTFGGSSIQLSCMYNSAGVSCDAI